MTKYSNDSTRVYLRRQLENERVRKSFRALINTSRMISIFDRSRRILYSRSPRYLFLGLPLKKNHPFLPDSHLRPMQFRYWPWLIHVDLAWRLSRENTRVPHDRDYASLEFIVSQLLASPGRST